jgi:hypothetical protein
MLLACIYTITVLLLYGGTRVRAGAPAPHLAFNLSGNYLGQPGTLPDNFAYPYSYGQNATLPAPVDPGQWNYEFLDVAPRLRLHQANPAYYIASNNPGAGYCGWAALSLLYNSVYSAAPAFRAEALQWWLNYRTDPTRIVELRQRIRDANGDVSDDPILDAWLHDLPNALTAAPGVMLGTGFAADLNTGSLWAFALMRNVEVQVHQVGEFGDDWVSQVVNPGAGQILHLLFNPASRHWQALIPVAEAAEALQNAVVE